MDTDELITAIANASYSGVDEVLVDVNDLLKLKNYIQRLHDELADKNKAIKVLNMQVNTLKNGYNRLGEYI